MKKLANQPLGLIGILISVIMILLLVNGIVTLNNKNQATLNSLTFEMQQQNFQQNAALIKSQWFLEGRPKHVLFSFFDENEAVANQVLFTVSKTGWPKLKNNEEVKYCQHLLEKVTNIAFSAEHKEIFIVTKMKKEDDITCQFCDAVNNEKCFNYSIR